MRKIQKLWWLVATAVVVVVLGGLLVAPAWAAASRQGDGPSSGAFDAMHASCAAGDVEGMQSAMGSLTEEDREAMAEHMATHMADGHHGAMGGPMMGSGGMMGGHMGQGMMNGVTDREPGRGMMGW
ncbi:MAG: hypothetical protein HYU29_06365 [Chloroflexi bacterium]|nr:hypothetical protein [Chloroflexota bacterium]